jgi:hypothetical protein
MYYEINVSLNGKHFFATHKRSVTTERECARLYVEFERAFPAREGYNLIVTRREEIGTGINPKDLPLTARDVVMDGVPTLAERVIQHETP